MDKTLTAILCITVLEGIALIQGVDGQIFSAVVGVIAGLGGYQYHARRQRKVKLVDTQQ